MLGICQRFFQKISFLVNMIVGSDNRFAKIHATESSDAAF